MPVLHSSAKADAPGYAFTTSNTIMYAEDFNADHVTDATPGGVFFAGAGTTLSTDAAFNYSSNKVLTLLGTLYLASSAKILVGSTGTQLVASFVTSSYCPASSAASPYTWLQVIGPDNSRLWVPAWK